MRNKYLVTGASGHLGNNLVRMLIEKGERVKAMTRNTKWKKPYKGLNVEVIYGNLLLKDSLKDLMRDVKTVYNSAFPVEIGSNKNEKKVVETAIKGTINLIDEAKKQGVKKIVHVSSIATLGNESSKENLLTEKDWNKNPIHPYVKAKVESEKIALKLGKKYNIWLVSVLPGTMVGPYCFKSTPIMKILKNIVGTKIHFNVNFSFSIVSVKDVAKSIYLAEKKGVKFNRYILTNEGVITLSEIIKKFGKGIKFEIGKTPLRLLSCLDVFRSKLLKKYPTITPETIDNFYNKKVYCDITKAKKELNWHPKSIPYAINKAIEWFNYEGIM
ncbi:MAG: NAD-dependent epimerase/dehydratase family protein [Nanoarchaeota archaeon]